MRLTDLAIQNAKPLAHQYTLWDETVKHFGLSKPILLCPERRDPREKSTHTHLA